MADARDHALMAEALRLAERALYTTSPNPRVGCVIARGDEIVGRGTHERAGTPHAEVHALHEAGECARGATAYVTLEPCSHVGRTAPCADALIAAGVERVVAACEDPFEKVSGKGFAKLRDAGIEVEIGVMRDAARELNRGFLMRCEHARPWVRLKLALSLDGRVALEDGRSQWITGPQARADNMRWRARSSALMTGIGTVLADDPRLSVRWDARSGEAAPAFKPPLRVILDSHLRTPPDANVMNDEAPTLLVCAPESVSKFRAAPDVQVMSCPHHATGLGLAVVLAELAQRGINELHVECGPVLAGALLHAELVDELLLYVNPSIIGDTGRALAQLPPLESLADRLRFRTVDTRVVGDDLRLLLRPLRP